MAYLALVRHGQSEYNKTGQWTGLTDVSLTQEGIQEAHEAGVVLKEQNILFQTAFTSLLTRAQQTLHEILAVLDVQIPIVKDAALNEKDYGIYTGKNKWEVEKQIGEEEFLKIRRSWDYVIPEGESLKMVYERVVPYYEAHIMPKLKQGENVLVVAHGNSLRALIKYLDHISDTDIPQFELKTGEIHLYTLDKNAAVLTKQVLVEHNTTAL
jgi:2,3-bisphosphoglycerate-dependent phosphoglycerate mutase